MRDDHEKPPEQALWCSVIYNAFQEATGVIRSGKHSRPAIQAEAVNWLTGNDPDFRSVCIMAGFEPEAVRERASQIINSGKQLRHGRIV